MSSLIDLFDKIDLLTAELERKGKVIEVLRDEAIDWHDIERVNKALADYDKGGV